MDALKKEAEAKLQMLQFTNGKSSGVMKKENIDSIERHRDTLRALVKEIEALKLGVEQAMFNDGEGPENVAEWSEKIEDVVAEVDDGIKLMSNWLEKTKHDANQHKREEEEASQARAREEQLKFESQKLKMKLEYERKLEETKANHPIVETEGSTGRTKLPKLQITKFKGTYEEWLPSWNKFHAEIEKSNLAPVTKFAYLKELLDPKVRTEIDGLPFTTEGYERAKNILTSEYGKTSEIVNAYVQNIMNLPVITGIQPARIYEFYKTLLYNVQSLETLGKFRDVSGNVRSVLDKLKGIKADLVRGHEDWQIWDFPQLVKALKRGRISIQSKTTQKSIQFVYVTRAFKPKIPRIPHRHNERVFIVMPWITNRRTVIRS